MKIGILGGSFDPIHNGHINMAVKAYEEYNLDEVWLMPAGHSPNKDETNMTGAIARYEMCKLAAEDYSFIKVSDHEIKKTSTKDWMNHATEQWSTSYSVALQNVCVS